MKYSLHVTLRMILEYWSDMFCVGFYNKVPSEVVNLQLASRSWGCHRFLFCLSRFQVFFQFFCSLQVLETLRTNRFLWLVSLCFIWKESQKCHCIFHEFTVLQYGKLLSGDDRKKGLESIQTNCNPQQYKPILKSFKYPYKLILAAFMQRGKFVNI